MICEEILGNLKEKSTDKEIRYVTIEWFERDKKVLRKALDSGEEIGIRCSQSLNEDDIIFEDENSMIVVNIAPCDLIKTTVTSMHEMGRLCFELGNRHLSLAITSDQVRCPYDAPTLEYLRRIGFASEKVHERFDGYIECKAHGHTHEHHAHG